MNGVKDEVFLDDIKPTSDLIECYDLLVNLCLKTQTKRMQGETISYKQESEVMTNRVNH